MSDLSAQALSGHSQERERESSQQGSKQSIAGKDDARRAVRETPSSRNSNLAKLVRSFADCVIPDCEKIQHRVMCMFNCKACSCHCQTRKSVRQLQSLQQYWQYKLSVHSLKPLAWAKQAFGQRNVHSHNDHCNFIYKHDYVHLGKSVRLYMTPVSVATSAHSVKSSMPFHLCIYSLIAAIVAMFVL